MQSVTGEADEYDIAQLTERAVSRFANDPEMRAAALAYAVRDLLPQVATQEFRRLREEARRDFDDAVAKKLERWYEHVGGTRHRKLFEMRRPELLFSAERREERASGELAAARFLRDLAGGLKSDTLRVSQRYTGSDVADVWRRHYEQQS